MGQVRDFSYVQAEALIFLENELVLKVVIYLGEVNTLVTACTSLL